MNGGPSRFRLDDLVVDLERRRVERAGVPLEVGGLSFDVLRYLIEQGDRVVGFDELIDQVWAPAVVNQETVTQRIKLLRQALGDDGRRSRYVRSVRSRGYQLCAVPIRIDDAPATLRAGWMRRHRALSVMITAAIMLAVAGVVWRGLVHSPSQPMPSARDALLNRARYYAGIGQNENNERAIAFYETMLAANPHDADALDGLSRAYSARVCLYNRPYEWADRAEALASRAIAESATDAAAWAALGYAHDCRGAIDHALDGYERALALDPGDDATRASAANLYTLKGRLADALRMNLLVRGDPDRVRFLTIQIARDLELLGFTEAAERRYSESFRLFPDNVFSNIAWPRHLFLEGRFADAAGALREARARGTMRVDLPLLAGELALLRGDRDGAERAFGDAAALRPQMSWPGTLVMLNAEKGLDRDALRERIGTLAKDIAGGDVYPDDHLELALLQAAADDRAAAFASFDAAIDAGFLDKAYLQVSPLFRSLSGEPAFAAAIDRISRRVAAERRRVLEAGWLPADLASEVRASRPE